MFARARARMRAKAMQLQAKHMLDAWLDVRVGVPWDADPGAPVYSGTVIGVRSGGRCLRKKLLLSRTVPTIFSLTCELYSNSSTQQNVRHPVATGTNAFYCTAA